MFNCNEKKDLIQSTIVSYSLEFEGPTKCVQKIAIKFKRNKCVDKAFI